MRIITMLLVIVLMIMCVPTYAYDKIFDYYQDFAFNPIGDGVFGIQSGYSYFNNGVWTSKIKDGGWVGCVVNVNGQEENKVYLEVLPNVAWTSSFKLATINVGEMNDSSYLLLDGSTATVKDSKGRVLRKYTNDKPNCIVKIGVLIDKTTNTADIFVDEVQIASDVEWKLSKLDKVSFCFNGNGSTADIRPNIDNIIVTCDETKFPIVNDVLDINIKEHSVQTTKSADKGVISRVLGNLYVSSSNTAYLYNQVWSDGSDFGSTINFDGRAKEKFYVKLSADLPTDWKLKLNTKNIYDSTYTDGIWLDNTKTTNNITKMDGTVIGSFDFSLNSFPTVELLVDQLNKRANLWIEGVRVATNIDINITNIDDISYLWSKVLNTQGIRTDKRIETLQITGEKSLLPAVDYQQNFQCPVQPNDEYYYSNVYGSYSNGVAKFVIKNTTDDGTGFEISTIKGTANNIYASVDVAFVHKVGLKITLVKDNEQILLVYFNGIQGKIYNGNNEIIGIFDNTLNYAKRNIKLYGLYGKTALVVDGKLISTNIDWANNPDKIAYKFVNTSGTANCVEIDNLVVTDIEEEFAPANLISDMYSNGEKVVVDVLNTNANGGIADFIAATYNKDNNLLNTIKINKLVIPQEKICTVGIPMPSAGTIIFVWDTLRPLVKSYTIK